MTEEDSGREERLHEVLGAYFEASADGQRPNLREWIDRYPEFASELESFFSEQDRLHRLAEPFRPLIRDESEERDADHVPGPGLAVRYFGDYELTAEIARGGMGIVFEARQCSLNRIVALKMILAGAFASEAERERFRLEAEAAANLDHPHIVPIYEVGQIEGHPYFTMRRLEGGSLAARLDEFVADPRAAAEVVAKVAHAVDHAHRRGVLHRDLKPSNVLLDATGQPSVVDFGLARRIESESDVTRTGAITGTPAYMAPEQASGRKAMITTSTDVHGLGAVLYALLTGRPPFRGESPLETIEQARDSAPEPPSRRNPRVDCDLETICQKCLEKDPTRRYETALAVAEDLERWLRGEPIAARSVGRLEHGWRWCRRNPAVAALSAAVALITVASLVGLAISNRLITRQRNAALQLRARAEARSRQSRDAADQMLATLGQSALLGRSRLNPDRKALLEKALEVYESLGQEQPEEQDDPVDQGHARLRRAELLASLERLPEAEDAFRQVIDNSSRLVAGFSDRIEPRRDLVKARIGLAEIFDKTKRPVEAIEEYRRTITLSVSIVQEQPAEVDHLRDLARAHQNLGYLLFQAGRKPEAETELRLAKGIFAGLAERRPEEEGYHFHVGENLKLLGYLAVHQGDVAEARRLWEDAVAHLRVAVKAKPYSAAYLNSLRDHLENLAGLMIQSGNPREAVGALEDAIERGKTLMSEYPDIVRFRWSLAQTHVNHAAALEAIDRFDEARHAIARSEEMYRSLVKNFPEVATYRDELAAVEKKSREMAEKTGVTTPPTGLPREAPTPPNPPR